MRIREYISILTCLINLVFLLSPTKVLAITNISAWKENTNLPYTAASTVSFSKADKLYLVGGSGNNDIAHSNVLRTDIGSNGVLSTWTTISNLPNPIIWHSLSIDNSRVYILGGYSGNTNDKNNYNSVYLTNIDSTGLLGSWQSLTPLPIRSALGSSVIINNRIYYAGGNLIPDRAGDLNYATSSIYMANIDPLNGTIGNWSPAGYLPDKMLSFGMLGFNNYLYILGGKNLYGNTANVKRAYVNSDGTLGPWLSEPSLPLSLQRAAVAIFDKTIIVAGGEYNGILSNNVFYAELENDGSFSSWSSGSKLLENNCCSSLVPTSKYLYLIGGHNGISYTEKVFSSKISNIVPTTKIFFAPGLGASWNLEAFIKCQNTGYTSEWSLAPYAESVYSTILTTLPPYGWIVKPFYYDWRKNVVDNGTTLANYIDANTVSDEKVDFIGHSMGGLVGRSYLEASEGGKLEKFLTVGTPHQGSALAYAPWSGGEMWTNNLIEKIALNLYLNHCGGVLSNNRNVIQSLAPSIQNLLPTVPYIRDSRTNMLKSVESMNAKNNYLPTNLIAPFWGVKVGTIAGSGIETLKIIDTINPSRKDIKFGNWLDGFPVGREYTQEGDGTVLTNSSQIDGAINTTIPNTTHRGLVASTEGINSILNFLGNPGIEDPPYSEDESALILIGYPDSFQITDVNDVVTQSKQGMIVIMNPTDATYQLQITPTSEHTTFIIEQLLPDNRTFYKEYKFEGTNRIIKFLRFSAKHPTKNLLHSIEEDEESELHED